VSSQNLGLQNSFRGASRSAFGYATAILNAIFTFSGFEQANYVLGEISQPHKKRPIGLGLASGLVCVLYLAVNICYWAVVPREMMLPQPNGAPPPTIAEAFFTLTLGHINTNDPYLGKRFANALAAISALGNIVVMMYSATRVKQEIAKEGLLPWPKFFAQNHDFSIGRLLAQAQKNATIDAYFGWLLRLPWLAPSNFQEKTPIGAMTLQILVCFILLFSTWSLGASNTLSFLGGLGTYLINAVFGVMLSGGLLYLHFSKRQNWREKSVDVNPVISVLAASIYFILNAFPIITLWIKPPNQSPNSLSWFLIPTVSVPILICGLLWWLGFVAITRRKDHRDGKVLNVLKVPDYSEDPQNSGRYVQTHETVYIYRRRPDNIADNQEEGRVRNVAARNRNPDFDDLDNF
jgi:amino acid transporter